MYHICAKSDYYIILSNINWTENYLNLLAFGGKVTQEKLELLIKHFEVIEEYSNIHFLCVCQEHKLKIYISLQQRKYRNQSKYDTLTAHIDGTILTSEVRASSKT